MNHKNSRNLKTIASIHTTCERIIEAPPVQLTPEALNLVSRLQKQAADLEAMARSPVKIGVVGELALAKPCCWAR